MTPLSVGARAGAYDPHLDRFDVGVRAVARLCRQSRRALLAELGVTPAEMAATQEALATLNLPLRSEDGLFELLAACPFLLNYALLLTVRYQARTMPIPPTSTVAVSQGRAGREGREGGSQ